MKREPHHLRATDFLNPIPFWNLLGYSSRNFPSIEGRGRGAEVGDCIERNYRTLARYSTGLLLFEAAIGIVVFS